MKKLRELAAKDAAILTEKQMKDVKGGTYSDTCKTLEKCVMVSCYTLDNSSGTCMVIPFSHTGCRCVKRLEHWVDFKEPGDNFLLTP